MSAPSHYIRTIHTSFTTGLASPSAYASASSSSHSNVLVNLGSVMNKYPPGLGPGEWRTGLASAPSGSGSGKSNSKKRPAYRLSYNSHRAPPPPPRTQPATSPSFPADAFSKPSHSYHPNPKTVVYSHSPNHSRTAPSSHYTVHIPEAVQPEDPDAKSKLVAGILLNRVHAVGKPMRRRPVVGSEPKTYVRSGLSRVVNVDAGEEGV